MTQQQRKVVLSDVAKTAGVHISTVSLALRNSPKVAAETKERVLKVAEALDYRPDPQLLSLIAYRKRLKIPEIQASIAVISDQHRSKSFDSNPYYSNIQQGIQLACKNNGFNPAFLNLGVDFQTSEQLDRILKSRGIRGILFNSIYDSKTRFKLDWDHYACVKINRFPEDLQIDSISGNGLLAIRLAFENALKVGYQRPALAVCQDDEAHIEHRYESAFLMLQQSLPVQNRIPPFVFPYIIGDDLASAISEWMDRERPDVVISNWYLNYWCFDYLLRTNRQIDFINMELTSQHSGMRGVIPDNEGIGRKAIEFLIQKLNRFEYGLPQNTSQLLVDPCWYDPQDPVYLRRYRSGT